MNFLAHLYLSGNDTDILIGNFIGDDVKGKSYLEYPEAIQKGILLHRAIDTFTDNHPLVRQSTKRLHTAYSHYSGIIVDIFYDHFLAKNWHRYSEISLEKFAANFYHFIQKHTAVLPESTQRMLPYMISGNWLESYAELDGIGEVLNNMDRRTGYVSKMGKAIQQLQEYYTDFETEFFTFFDELQAYCKLKIEGVIS